MKMPLLQLAAPCGILCFVLSSAGQIFSRVTTGPTVDDGGSSHAAGWGDYDNDGDLDLFVAHHGRQNDLLARNDGQGNFTKIQTGPLVHDEANSYGAVWGDYDNDGLLDLFVSTFGTNLLYHNIGGGAFALTSNFPPSTNDVAQSTACAWVDYDRDGRLDLFVTNWKQAKNFLYRNNGDGTFTRITEGSIAEDAGESVGCAWGDYDNDGNPDLFVANQTGHNFLYHNNGNGTFTRVTSGPIALDPARSYGGSWADYDNDGNLDLFVANSDQPNALYRNRGDGTFENVTADAMKEVASFWASAWGDYDNDGDLDLFVANTAGNNVLFENLGDGTFRKVTNEVVTADRGFSVACVWVDYDNDGQLDLYVSNHGQNNFFYRNNGTGNAWLEVDCIGRASNRSAIGARVRIKAEVNGKPLWQMREISEGDSVSGKTLRAHFGLKRAAKADIIRVEWPSGMVQEFQNEEVNRLLTITEPAGQIQRSRLEEGQFRFDVLAPINNRFEVQVSSDFRQWESLTNVITRARVSDIRDPSLLTSRRFYRIVP